MDHCLYYQATIRRPDCWFFVAVLRSFEHVVFDRTFDVQNSIFEFFVPQDMEPEFLKMMAYFEQRDIATNLEKLPNRLLDPAAKV